MDLYAVMDEIATRLKTITGLHVEAAGLPGKVVAPAAVVYAPNRIAFDSSYGRGSDAYDDLGVVIFVAMRDRRSAFKELSAYLAGSGAKSIKAVVDTAGGAYTSAMDVQVQWAEVDQVTIGGTDYLAGLFHLQAFGKGA